ncbi:MAG: DUF2309 domain-containing protein [Myxococcales bacterium]|nr:MAG: DUF2309 domain-containing protein [Myxococcales bacterium]
MIRVMENEALLAKFFPDNVPSLEAMLEQAAKLLPEQAVLQWFVHHNTLHSFEHLEFEKAVITASAKLGTEAFQSEAKYRDFMASGRIIEADLDFALQPSEQRDEAELFVGGPTVYAFRKMRLKHLFEIPQGSALNWLLSEGNIKKEIQQDVAPERKAQLLEQAKFRFGELPAATQEALLLESLWNALHNATAETHTEKPLPRRRDQILELFGIDTDDWVHSMMIRLAGAYLDQGLAYWSMPNRERGFLNAFRSLYSLPYGPPDRWRRALSELLKQQHGWSAEQTVRWTLQELSVPEHLWPTYIEKTLLSLRGWAGMFRQFELDPKKAPVKAWPATLMDYLAVQLILDLLAVRYALKEQLGDESAFEKIEQILSEKMSRVENAEKDLSLVYEAFVLAQHSDLNLGVFFDLRNCACWLDEVKRFNTLERKRLLQRAFEHRHLVHILDTLQVAEPIEPQNTPAAFQAVFCIDDREESYRRHLEEVDPSFDTYGYPGFFGVAMAYQGPTDVRPRALCPVSMQATHFVQVVQDQKNKSIFSHWHHMLFVGSSTLIRGFIITLFGSLAAIPLIFTVLFPRLFASLIAGWSPSIRKGDRLLYERQNNIKESDLPIGYTHEEMANVVEKMLRETGLENKLSNLVFLVGHGSISVNNPHLAAYGCGATAGGSGGSNARVCASMANHPRVREILASRGLPIPQNTHFIGCLHDTCTDDVFLFDEEDVPSEHEAAIARAKKAFGETGLRNSKERCRLFGVVSTSISPKQAKAIVHRRSIDLSEPRPEYNHTKNSLCIVGQRKWTRGLFLDQRAFLVSYDPKADPSGERLEEVLMGSVPVGVGINLEYFFSHVDNRIYGAGSKLPHNITGLFAVMDGHASDLRTGLYQQMIEIHEAVRMVSVIQASPQVLKSVMKNRPGIENLVKNKWLELVAWDPENQAISWFKDGEFQDYVPESDLVPLYKDSLDYCENTRLSLPFAKRTCSADERQV